MSQAERILIIKHGALGDFVQAVGPCQAIRRHHGAAQITLLTTAPFEAFAQASGLFDEIWLDPRAPVGRIGAWLALRRRLRGGGFARVYDLQTSRRSSLYFHLFPHRSRPEWSGIARGCSLFHAHPERGSMHTVDRQRDQLQGAGIAEVALSDLSWVEADLERFALPERFALLVPGGAAHRPAKRWPAGHYAALARALAERAVTPVILGGPDEGDLGAEIVGAAGSGLDLSGQTSLLEIAALARRAALAVGNDTGPMHLIAAAGTQCAVLFSDASDPARCAPRGPGVLVQRKVPLKDLPVAEVLAVLC